MKALICLSKYQDWLEAYSVLDYYKSIDKAKILYLEDKRNNESSVKSLYDSFKSHITFEYQGVNCKKEYFSLIGSEIETLGRGDVVATQFVKYRDIWKFCNKAKKKGIITVHLSETLPDSFGLIGYRLGFRWVKRDFLGILKNIISIPIMYIYALTHKPDVCFYNLYPTINNVFVKETRKASVPSLTQSKFDVLRKLMGQEQRSLIIGGFGYDSKKIAEFYHLKKYVATTKGLSIIIDGEEHPLIDYINAEDVLIGGYANRVIGYNSTVIGWAYRFGNIEIDCYEAEGLNKCYGRFGYFSRKTFKRCGIQLKPSNPAFMN